MRLRCYKQFFFVLLLVSTLLFSGCTVFGKKDPAAKHEKRLNKTKKKRAKEEAKAYRENIKKHMKIQSKSTRKRMKKHRKQSKKIIDMNAQ